MPPLRCCSGGISTRIVIFGVMLALTLIEALIPFVFDVVLWVAPLNDKKTLISYNQLILLHHYSVPDCC